MDYSRPELADRIGDRDQADQAAAACHVDDRAAAALQPGRLSRQFR